MMRSKPQNRRIQTGLIIFGSRSQAITARTVFSEIAPNPEALSYGWTSVPHGWVLEPCYLLVRVLRSQNFEADLPVRAFLSFQGFIFCASTNWSAMGQLPF
jgi:hypothetical protein